MSPKGQNIFVSFNMFLFLRIIINGQHYIILSKAFIKAGYSRHKAESHWNQVQQEFRVNSQDSLLILDAQSMQGLSINGHLTFCTRTKPCFLFKLSTCIVL